MQVRSARLNQPDDPPKFTLGDLGVEAGSRLSYQNDSNDEGWTWNGERVCKQDEWYADLKAGRREWGPTFRRVFQEKKPYDSPYMTDKQRARLAASRRNLQARLHMARHEGLWTKYVTDFIRKYKLDDEQTQKAMSILTDCQAEAKRHMEAYRPRLTELVPKMVDARDTGDHKEAERIERELEELRAPLDRIFESSLKPRLERLPTRAQRRAVEGMDAP